VRPAKPPTIPWAGLVRGIADFNLPRTEQTQHGRHTYEERSVEELRERAGELQIEGRSSMSKDDLVAALRQHSK
jgi:Rho termination factor, N-terminal domain